MTRSPITPERALCYVLVCAVVSAAFFLLLGHWVWVSRAAGAMSGPTAVDERLAAIAVPKVVTAGRYVYWPNAVTGSATFAATYLTEASLRGNPQRRNSWRSDPHLPEARRPTEADYKESGWDIGHELGAQLFGNQDDQNAGFMLSNAGPQHPHSNRGPWNRHESEVISDVKGKRTKYVVVGLVYLSPKIKAISPRLLVPSHYVSAVLTLDDGRPVKAEAWMFPNTAADVTSQECLIAVDELEELAELDFFPWLPDELEERLESVGPQH